MRILIFHGYLLRGTGSNIYNASLVRALARLGHEVHLLCQDRDWDRPPRACTVHNPDIGRVLPVYVADRYEGFDAKPYAELSDAELEHYLEANVAAVAGRPHAGRRARQPPGDGPRDPRSRAGRARSLRGQGPRQRAGVHGAPAPRALPALRAGGRQGRLGRAGGLAPHRREPLGGARRRARAAGAHAAGPARGRRARVPPAGRATSSTWPRGWRRGDAAAWGGEAGAADALRALDPGEDRIVSFVGKLIVSKGVDLLLAAWPLVVARVPEARLCDRRVRDLPRGARPLRRGAAATATSTTCARSRRAGASWRAARRAS